MSLINSVVYWYFKERINRINYLINHAVKVQHDLLLQLLNKAKDTEWGRERGFGSIRSYRDFTSQVPLQHYEDIKPFIDRMVNGEQNLLWPSEIRWFAKSSGTTSDKSKFIPMSQEALRDCHYKAGKDVLSIFCRNYPKTNIFSGKGLIMGGSHKVSEINEKASMGDLSAILLQNFPSWFTFLRTPDKSLALIEDWEEKIVQIAKKTIHENVTSISGVPSWNLLLLKKVLEAAGKEHIPDIWPNLELFIHGGVSFIPYREQFQSIIPSEKMVYLETYNASEGFFGIQDTRESDDLLLMPDYGIFYEFIPMNTFHDPVPVVVPIEAVKTGTNYALVISTNAGLWRYVIGDTIMFTSTRPYRFKITGRTRHFINAFGEEVIVENTDNALATACKSTGAVITEYTAGPVYLNNNQAAAHQYIIEFEKEPDSFEEFIHILDRELQKLNSDYEAKRTANLLLRLPIVVAAPRNTFFNWLKSLNKIGGQNKVPRLFNTRKYLDDILQFIGKESTAS